MGLQVWLPLNGNLDNQGLADVSVTSGTAKYKTGKIGNGLDLSSKIVFSCPKLVGLKQFTIMFWVKIEDDDGITSNWQDIFGTYEQKADGSSYGQFRAETYYNPKTVSLLGVHWHDNTNYGITSGTLPTHYTGDRGVWHHCAIVVDSDQFIKSYTDGVLKNEYTTGLEGGHLYNGTFWIGETNNIAGCVNDVRIYDNCLSPREVKEISKGLVLHYSLAMPGQENLLSIQISDNHWVNWGSSAWNTNNSREKILGDDGRTWAHIVQNTSDGYGGYACDPAYNSIVIDSSKRYTWSCLAKAGTKENAEIILWCHWRSTEGGANLTQNSKKFLLTSNPQRISWTLPQYTNDTYTVNRINLMMGTSGTGNNEIYFTDVKFEEGEIATPWIPNPADAEYSTLGFDDGIEYDVSGYGHNGTKATNITYNADTPRYNVSTVFNGSSNSWIKVLDNTWMVDKATEITINWWARVEDWTAITNGGRMMSCTESGGFNIEGGSSGYVRFPRYVYKSADYSTKGYQYSNTGIKLADLIPGWHMFTLIYNMSGEKIYIDGSLYSEASYTSYGLSFNKNARLFLGCEASTANPGGQYFNGKMSDFRIYYTALSPDDVLELYHTSASLADNGTLLGYEYVET